MKRLTLFLLFSGAITAAASLLPFPATGAVQSPDGGGTSQGSRESSSTNATYQQLDIFRRVLSRRLAYQRTPQGTFNSLVTESWGQQTTAIVPPIADAWVQVKPTPGVALMPGQGMGLIGHYQDAFTAQPEVDTLYLPGTGMILSVALTNQDRVATRRTGTAQPTDAWDRAEQEVTGSRPDRDPSKPPEEPKSQSLQDVVKEQVARTMMEYGHRLNTLPEGERLIVVVTLVPAVTFSGGAFVPYSVRLNPPPMATTMPSGQATTAAAPAAEPTDDASRALRLGDLHLRQGRYGEAEAAFTQAAAAAEKAGDMETIGQIYSRLAQIALQNNKIEQAEKLLARAKEIRLKKGDKGTKKSEKAEVVRLIISATKRSLQRGQEELARTKSELDVARAVENGMLSIDVQRFEASRFAGGTWSGYTYGYDYLRLPQGQMPAAPLAPAPLSAPAKASNPPAPARP